MMRFWKLQTLFLSNEKLLKPSSFAYCYSMLIRPRITLEEETNASCLSDQLSPFLNCSTPRSLQARGNVILS